MRITFDAGPTARELHVGEPSTEPVEPLDDYRQKVLRAARPRHRLPVRADRPARRPAELRRARPRRRRRAGAGRPAEGAATPRRSWRAWSRTPTERHPEGVTRVVLLGDPTKALGALSEPECARVIAALDLAERMRVPLEWFALSAGARISMTSGTENMDWVAAALKRIVDVHPGRRRDQHRGRGHQRRRPAVLERRGDDAHAHQGHPGDDAGLGDGAHRQAVAGLLRRRVGRGQLRHRRLRPGDGPERPGAVLGARTCRPPATC